MIFLTPKKRKRQIGDGEQSLDLYLAEIGETPLITGAEEIILAQRIKQNDQTALNKMTEANLRFVVSVAKNYINQGLPLGDLINEGNIGLMKAAKRFDETRGFKFISYAVWWIRQAILQALAETSRIVRLPINRAGTLHKIGKITSKLEQSLGREPSPGEIAKELDLAEKEVADTIKIASHHISLDAPFDRAEESDLLDVLADEFQPLPDEHMISTGLRDDLDKVLDSLTPRQAEVIDLYFGLSREKPLTLEEIGARFNLTRERIRQIKEKAIKRLRHASRSKKLREYLD